MKLLYSLFGILLASTTVLAQVGGPGVSAPGTGGTGTGDISNLMNKDASNATLPDARNNLELGTVRSEGGDSPNADAITRFYNWSGKKQFEIGTSEYATETVLEQSGLPPPGGVGVGQGATRLCWAPFSNHQVNCNYVAFGSKGQHRFANGAGYMAELINQGVGEISAWLQFRSSDDEISRIWAAGATDVKLELKGKGQGSVDVWNGVGGKLASFINAQASANDRYIKLIGGTATADPRIQVTSDDTGIPDVSLRLLGKGTGGITFENDHGTLGRFDSSGAGGTRVWLRFLGGDGTLAVVGSESPNYSDVPIYLVAQGKGSVIIANQDDVDGGNNLAIFSSKTSGYAFGFNQQDTAGRPASIGSSGGSMALYGQRFRSICPSAATDPWPPTYPCFPSGSTQSNFAVTNPDSGTFYTNTGATGLMNFYLYPAAATSIGAYHCFTRDVAQTVRITANGTDKIAIAPTNSAPGGYIDTNGDFASICLTTYKAGQWVAYNTPDKTQWGVH